MQDYYFKTDIFENVMDVNSLIWYLPDFVLQHSFKCRVQYTKWTMAPFINMV